MNIKSFSNIVNNMQKITIILKNRLIYNQSK